MSNLVKGTKFTAQFPIFTGNYPNSRFSHNANITATIEKESYGVDKGQHTFTFKVEESDDREFEVGKNYRKKGRNMYPNLISVESPSDYEEKAREKEFRASAQAARNKNRF